MYGSRVKMLSKEYDTDDMLDIDDRINLYRRMMDYDELRPFAIESVTKLVKEASGRELEKYRVFNLKMFIPHRVAFYDDEHNVHGLSAETVRVAINIINKWPCNYHRPRELSFPAFFTDLEQSVFYDFDPKKLFASIWMCVTSSPHSCELKRRVNEELSDATGMCLTGCITRLVNVIRGFQPDFETIMDDYEYARSKVYYELNKHINPYEDDILNQIVTVVNSGTVSLPEKHALFILKAYTGETWRRIDGMYVV